MRVDDVMMSFRVFTLLFDARDSFFSVMCVFLPVMFPWYIRC
jgi:hypothetical protein